jgi:hypothetical protein
MLRIETTGLLAVWTVAGRTSSPSFHQHTSLKNFVEFVQFTFLIYRFREEGGFVYSVALTLCRTQSIVSRNSFISLGYFQFK